MSAGETISLFAARTVRDLTHFLDSNIVFPGWIQKLAAQRRFYVPRFQELLDASNLPITQVMGYVPAARRHLNWAIDDYARTQLDELRNGMPISYHRAVLAALALNEALAAREDHARLGSGDVVAAVFYINGMSQTIDEITKRPAASGPVPSRAADFTIIAEQAAKKNQKSITAALLASMYSGERVTFRTAHAVLQLIGVFPQGKPLVDRPLADVILFTPPPRSRQRVPQSSKHEIVKDIKPVPENPYRWGYSQRNAG